MTAKKKNKKTTKKASKKKAKTRARAPSAKALKQVRDALVSVRYLLLEVQEMTIVEVRKNQRVHDLFPTMLAMLWRLVEIIPGAMQDECMQLGRAVLRGEDGAQEAMEKYAQARSFASRGSAQA